MRQSAVWFLIFGILAAGCEDPPPPSRTATLSSRVELVAGDVRLVSASKRVRLITGAMLEERAKVEVAQGGRALIRLDSGAGIFLKENSAVEINGDALSLTQGELWADIPKSDDEMAKLTAGKVIVNAEDAGIDLVREGDRVRVYVARGIALVSGPGGRTEVQSGEQATFEGTRPPKIEPVAFFEDWTGGLADRPLTAGSFGQGAGTIYGIDRSRPGATPEALQITRQSVTVTIRNGIAQTIVDQRFFNPSGVPLEGFYWFTVPEGASVYRFALEVNGALVNGEIVERQEAAAAYEAAVQQAFDPALLEWVDGKSFRARIFPIPAAGERRVVLSYFESLPLADGVYRYLYPMAAGDVTVQEFSLTVDLGDEGDQFEARTLGDAKIEADKRRISMRRSGFNPKADFMLELVPKEAKAPLTVMRYSGRGEAADYVMVRVSPEVEWQKLTKVVGDVVVVLDTSAGGDEADRSVRSDAVEAVLRALSDGDRFAVVSADLVPRVIYPEKGLAPADEKHVSRAIEKLSDVASAGATDLGSMFSSALNLVHGADQPAVVYVGDGNATLGETTSDDLASRLRRALGESRARLFTIAVGADANLPLLDRLARLGGGRSFAISDSEQTVQEALRFVSLLKTPTLTDLRIDAGKGLDQVFLSAAGKVSEGDEIILLARTHHALPGTIRVSGKLGEKPFEKQYAVKEEKDSDFGFIPILWAGRYLTDLMQSGLDENRGRIIALGLGYSLMTPFTSFLVLENDNAYIQQGIKRQERHFFSDVGLAADEAALAAETHLSIPLGLFGCAGEEAPSQAAMEQVSPSVSEEARAAAPSPPMATISRSEAEATGDMAKSMPAMPQGAPAAGSGSMGMRDSAKGGAEGRGYIGKDEGVNRLTAPAPEKKKRARENHTDTGESAPSDDEMGNYLSTAASPKDAKSAEEPSQAFFTTGVCSDASHRSLTERRMLWGRRLAMTPDTAQYVRLFTEAGRACELPKWRDRKAMLDLMDAHVHQPDQVGVLLSTFQAYPSVARYLRQRILRRAFDPDQLLGDSAGETYWPSFRAGLSALTSLEEQEKRVRALIVSNPQEPRARELLVEILVRRNKTDEALKEALALRREGLASPKTLTLLCDLQAGLKNVSDARRTCSELVEFNPADPKAHQALGDMFLRHGWYQEAYRQYTGLVKMIREAPFALLRLAAAAAGMGKVDEALRIERKVASGDGEEGPDDPRRAARLHSAVRLASLLLEARKANDATLIASLERQLKRTQVLGNGDTMIFLVWEDFQTALSLDPKQNDQPVTPTETLVSTDTGLVMIDLGKAPLADIALNVRQTGEAHYRAVPYILLFISFDGKRFTIEERPGNAA